MKLKGHVIRKIRVTTADFSRKTRTLTLSGTGINRHTQILAAEFNHSPTNGLSMSGVIAYIPFQQEVAEKMGEDHLELLLVPKGEEVDSDADLEYLGHVTLRPESKVKGKTYFVFRENHDD